MQLQLYPANLTKEQFAAGQSAISSLPLALGPKVNQKINGDWSLQFEYPEGYAIRPDMLVLADGQLYRITEVEPEGVKTTVRALHLFYDLRDRMIVNIETAETTPGGINQKIALQQVLNGTPFEAGEVDTDLVLDYLDILQKDAVWAIKEQVLGFWGGEMQIDNWTINIRKKMGADKGVQLRHGKNIKGIRYSESLDGVITRLHILGYRNANIESINDGKDYIDSPNIGLYANIKEGLVTFSDDDLPEDLLSKGIEYLATVDTPRVTVSVDMAKVLTSVQFEHYADLERMELGDTVRIIHPMGVNIETRVTSREYDPVTGENIRVEYSNESKNLYTSIASAQQASEIIKMITDRKGHIRGEQLRGMVDLLTTRLYASGSYNVAEVRENEGMLFENIDEESVDYGALFIGPGLFAIASAKDENGSWVWRTFGTGQGFVADEIVAGVLQASLVKILGTDQFYWDADSIRVIDPVNPLKQLRIGRYDGINYGIGFTQDGGLSWGVAVGFDGIDLTYSTIPRENITGLSEVLDGMSDAQAERSQEITELIEELTGTLLELETTTSEDNAVVQAGINAINAAIKALEDEADALRDGLGEEQEARQYTDQFIKAGLLYVDEQGVDRYGVAVGENLTVITDESGKIVLKREGLACTMTSDRISFWQLGKEAAYFSSGVLFVNEINTKVLKIGKVYEWEFATNPTGGGIRWGGV